MQKQNQSSFFSYVPFLRVVLFFMAGIQTGKYIINTSYYWLGYIALVLLVSGYTIFFIAQSKKSHPERDIFFGLFALSVFFLGGITHFLQQDPTHNHHHITHVANKVTQYRGVIISEVTPKKRYKEVILEVIEVCIEDKKWQKREGKIILLVPKKQKGPLSYGTVLQVKGTFSSMKPPTNPYEVDYDTQWTIQGIFHRHIAKNLKIIGYEPPNQLKKHTLQIRQTCAKQLSYYCKDKTTLGITLALVLGIRNNLEDHVREVYTMSGVMHILAVSGLHIGILYTLLLWLFFLLSSLIGKPGQYPLPVLGFLWMYSFITGFSPSVLRAVAMLSLVIISKQQQRNYHIINLLSIVSFFLLLYNPYLLFDVGFQLSFSAVLSIVLLYPGINKLYHTQYRSLRYIWQMTAVSVAVQIGTLPITLYYFKYFPTYFLLANWVMLPLATILFSLGILILLLSWWPLIAGVLAHFIDKLLTHSTSYLAYLANLPYAQLGPLDVTLWQITLYYAILTSVYLAMRTRHFRYIVITSCLIMIFSVSTSSRYLNQKHQKKIIVYDTAPHHVIAYIEGKRATLITKKTLQPYESTYLYKIKPSLVRLGMLDIQQYTLGEYLKAKDLSENTQTIPISSWQGKNIAIVNQKHPNPSLVPSTPLHIDILVVEEDAVQDLNQWKQHTIDMLVIGSTNKKAENLALQACKHKIPYHIVAEKGAWIYTFPS